jgi:hypothetical protein
MSAPPTLSAKALDAPLCAQITGELVEVAATLANAQLDSFTTRLAQALQDAGQRSADPALNKLYASAAALLRKNRYPFSFVTAERVHTVLRHELQAAARGLPNPGEAGGALKSLAPDVEVDKTLCLRKAGRTIEDAHSEHLSVLGLRLAFLFGRAQLAPAPHPFRPQIFLNAVHDAWCEFQPDIAAHALVFPLLGPALCLDLAPILHAANMALVKRGILPQLQAAPAAVSAPAITAPGKAAKPTAPGDPLAQRLHALLGDPSAPATAAAETLDAFPTLLEPHALGRTPLLDYLDTLHKNLFDQHLAACGAEGPHSASVLTHVRRHAPRGSMAAADEHVVELLAAVFDGALREPAIAPELKVMIASLQLPVLRAVLADHGFFFRPDQPARRTIELLAELAVGWERAKGPTDPVYLAMKRNVERVQRGAEERIGVFVDAVWDLESFMRREQTASDQILAAPIAQALKQEKRKQAEKSARDEVALRIGTGEVVAFVETFLEDQWVPVLTLAYTEQEQKPQAVRDALKTMDDLVWSVKPKITAAERKELLAMLPRMVADLNRWLDLAGCKGEARSRFFSDLATCHASLVRAPLDISPRRQVELALEVAKKATERRLQRQARQAPVPEPDEFDRRVGTLARGAWVDFVAAGGTRRLKLAWISPMRNLFIFATGKRQHALSLSDQELATALRDGRGQILEVGNLVQRALCATLGIPPANQSPAKSAA